MNPIRVIRRAAGILAGLTAALAFTAVPAVLASTSPTQTRPLSWAGPPLPPGWNKHPPLPAQVHSLATEGMPGWQIILIGAAVLAATAAVVLLARARAARRRAAASPA